MSFLTPLRKYVPAIGAFLLLLILSYLIPLTIDEVWNYVNVASKPFSTIITFYDYPNNHIFYSLLVRLGITHVYVLHPHAIRLVSCVTTVILLELLCSILHIQTLWKKFGFFVGFLFFSPLLLFYSVLSRGYMLGSLLFLLSLFFLQKRKIALSSLFGILSIYTVPTFLYAFPGIWIYLLIKKDVHLVIRHALYMVVGVLFVYLPVLSKLILHTQAKWNDVSYGVFLRDTIYTAFFFPKTIIVLILGGIGMTAIVAWNLFLSLRTKQTHSLQLFLCIAIVSYVGVIGILHYTRGMNPPFVRNGVFLIVFLYTLCLFLAKQYRWFRFLFSLYLFGNILLGTTVLVQFIKQRETPPLFSYFGTYPMNAYEYPRLSNHIYLFYSSDYDSLIHQYLSSYYHFPYAPETPEAEIHYCSGEDRQSFSRSEGGITKSIVLCPTNIRFQPNEIRLQDRKEATSAIPVYTNFFLFIQENGLNSVFKKIQEKFIVSLGTWVVSTSPINPEFFLKIYLKESDKNYTTYYQQMKNNQSTRDSSVIFKAEHYMTLISDGLNHYQLQKTIPKELAESIDKSLELHSTIIQDLQKIYGTTNTDLNTISQQYDMNTKAIQTSLDQLRPQ